MRDAFIQDHRAEQPISALCRVMAVHRSGYYAWIKEPYSPRTKENLRLTNLICHFHAESDQVYGIPRTFKDLRESGEYCGENRVARLMQRSGIRATRGYKKQRYRYSKPSEIYPNRFEQKFEVEQPDEAQQVTYQ